MHRYVRSSQETVAVLGLDQPHSHPEMPAAVNLRKTKKRRKKQKQKKLRLQQAVRLGNGHFSPSPLNSVNRLTVNWCGGLIGKGRLGDGAPLISFTHSGFHSVRRRKLIEISRNSRKKKDFVIQSVLLSFCNTICF